MYFLDYWAGCWSLHWKGPREAGSRKQLGCYFKCGREKERRSRKTLIFLAKTSTHQKKKKKTTEKQMEVPTKESVSPRRGTDVWGSRKWRALFLFCWDWRFLRGILHKYPGHCKQKFMQGTARSEYSRYISMWNDVTRKDTTGKNNTYFQILICALSIQGTRQ